MELLEKIKMFHTEICLDIVSEVKKKGLIGLKEKILGNSGMCLMILRYIKYVDGDAIVVYSDENGDINECSIQMFNLQEIAQIANIIENG